MSSDGKPLVPTVRGEGRSAVQRETTRALQLAAPHAVGVLLGILHDKRASSAARVQAAKVLLDRAGYVPPTPAKLEEDKGKQLNEMTPDELRETIDKHDDAIREMERALADQATLVSAPNEGANADEAAEMLD